MYIYPIYVCSAIEWKKHMCTEQKPHSMLYGKRGIPDFTPLNREAVSIIQDISGMIRDKLDPLTRAQQLSSNTESYLAAWLH